MFFYGFKNGSPKNINFSKWCLDCVNGRIVKSYAQSRGSVNLYMYVIELGMSALVALKKINNYELKGTHDVYDQFVKHPCIRSLYIIFTCSFVTDFVICPRLTTYHTIIA